MAYTAPTAEKPASLRQESGPFAPNRSSTERVPAAAMGTLGMGMLGISLAWQIYNAYLPLILQAGRPDFAAGAHLKGFALSPSAAGFVMTLDNIAALLILPYVGVLSDRTRTRWGRRLPYVAVGMPIAVLSFFAIPLAVNAGLIALLATIFVFLLAMDLFRTPLVALMPDLTPSRHRSTANGFITVLYNVGTVLAYGLGGVLFRVSVAAPFYLEALGLLLGVGLVLLLIREPRQTEAEDTHAQDEAPTLAFLLKSLVVARDASARFLLGAVFVWTVGSSAVEIFFSSFIIQRFGIDPGRATSMMAFFGMAALLGAVPAGFAGKRWGRRNAIRVSLCTMTLLLLSVNVVGTLPALRFTLIGMGLSWSLVMVNALPMVLDLSPSRKTGGAYAGLHLLATQAASIVGPVLAGAVLSLAGHNYQALFVYIPALMFTALLLMNGVRHGEAR